MPCNDPTLNLNAIILMKILMTDKDSLALALYDLSKEHASFFYQETATGFEIQSDKGNLILTWDGTKYTVRGNERTGQIAAAQILRRYQAIKVQSVLVEKGYLTEQTPLEGNRIQLTARRY